MSQQETSGVAEGRMKGRRATLDNNDSNRENPAISKVVRGLSSFCPWKFNPLTAIGKYCLIHLYVIVLGGNDALYQAMIAHDKGKPAAR